MPLVAVVSDDMPEVDERAAIDWPALDLEHGWGLATPAAESQPAAEVDPPQAPGSPMAKEAIEEPRSEPTASPWLAAAQEAVGFVEPGDTSALPPESPPADVLPAPPAANRAGWLSRTFHRRPATNDEEQSSAPDIGAGAQPELLHAAQPAGEVGADETAQVGAAGELDLDALMAAVAAFPIDAIARDSAEAAASEPEPHRPEAQVTGRLPAEEPEPATTYAPDAGLEWGPPLEADPVSEASAHAPLELAAPDRAEWDVAMGRQPIDEPLPEPAPEAPPAPQPEPVPVPSAQDLPVLEPESVSPAPEATAQPPLISFVAPLTRQGPPADRFAPVATSALPPAAVTRACVSCELPLSARVVFCRRCGSRQPELSQVVG